MILELTSSRFQSKSHLISVILMGKKVINGIWLNIPSLIIFIKLVRFDFVRSYRYLKLRGCVHSRAYEAEHADYNCSQIIFGYLYEEKHLYMQHAVAEARGVSYIKNSKA